MIKQASFFRRRPDVSFDDFHEYWRTRHADVVRNLPGMVRYVQNHVMNESSLFHGVAEVWFEDIDAMRANVGHEALADIRADEAHFIDPDSMGALIVDERVPRAPAGANAKLLSLVKAQPGKAPEPFVTTYRDELPPLVATVPGLVGYAQGPCRSGAYRDGRQPPYDAVSSLWFDDSALALASEELKRIAAFEATFIDQPNTWMAFVEEVEIDLP